RKTIGAAFILDEHIIFTFFASKLAPTERMPQSRRNVSVLRTQALIVLLGCLRGGWTRIFSGGAHRH
ncbi:hypothetical protein, partial [Pseudomonas fluorescens]|uniref:hypothetical protein n=1 Tax=Pseudomonas fluorescens TaxID=294 RepID=UPI001E59F8C4